MVRSPSRGEGPVTSAAILAAILTAFTFGVIGVLALAWGVLHVAGRGAPSLPPSRPPDHPGLAIINLVLFPFGTGLGGYALWVLLNDEGRSLFVEQCKCTKGRPFSVFIRLTLAANRPCLCVHGRNGPRV